MLLRQLLKQLDTIPNDIVNEYSRYCQDPHGRMPDEDTYAMLLKSAVEQFYKANTKPVFILVDAYDELSSSREEKYERATHEREKVRPFLSLLDGTGRAKILITTRLHYREELRNSFRGPIMANVHGDLSDMRLYLRDRLVPLRLRQALKNEITEKLLLENETDKW
jgi:hypothetical protein